MRFFFKPSILVSAAAALGSAAVFIPTLASAQAVGNVISSTPVMKRVTETERGCRPAPQRECALITEDRLIGYKVVYEYQGKQHEVQLPFAVGATIPIEVSASGIGPAATPTISAPVPSYESGPRVVERVYVEPAYGATYRSRVYADDSYSYSQVLPIALGLAFGLGASYYWGPRYYGPRGYVGYRSGHRGGGHWRR